MHQQQNGSPSGSHVTRGARNEHSNLHEFSQS